MEKELSPLETIVGNAGATRQLSEEIAKQESLENSMNAITEGAPYDPKDYEIQREFLKIHERKQIEKAAGLWDNERDSLFEGKDYDLAQRALFVQPYEGIGKGKRYEAHVRAHELVKILDGKADEKTTKKVLEESIRAGVEERYANSKDPTDKYVSKETRENYIALSMAAVLRSGQIKPYLEQLYNATRKEFEGTFAEEGREKEMARYVRSILEASVPENADINAKFGALQALHSMTAKPQEEER